MSVYNEKRGAHAESVTQNIDTVYTPDGQDYTRSVIYPQLTGGQLAKNTKISTLLYPKISSRINTNTQYISGALTSACAAYDYILVRSDMSTGKTYGMRDVIANYLAGKTTIVVTGLRALVRGNKERLDALIAKTGLKITSAHYSDESGEKLQLADVIYTTLHSLPKVISEVGSNIGLVMIDEIESVAGMMTAGIMDKNRASVIDALEHVAKSGVKTLLLDAHLGAATYAFCNAFFPDKQWALITNSYTRWAGVEYQWLVDPEKGFAGNAEKLGIAKVAELLRKQKHVFVTTGSKEQAKRIYNALKKLGLLDNIKVLRAFDDNHSDSDALERCKNNHDLFNDFDLVIGTPAIGTGISIEPRKGVPHFDDVVSFFAKSPESPDAISSMQLPFRVRQTTSNKIWCVACTLQGADSRRNPNFVIQRDFLKQVERYKNWRAKNPSADGDDAIRSMIFATYAAFEGALQIHDNHLWENYFDVINEEFERKGMVRAADESTEAPEEVLTADKQARMEAKTEKFNDVFTAREISDSQAIAIEMKLKTGGKVDGGDKLSLKKHKLIRDYAPSDYVHSEESFKALMAKKDKSYMLGIKNIANSALPLPDVNRVCKIWATHDRYAIDATSKKAISVKAEWKLDNILGKLLKISVNDGVYNIGVSLIKKQALTSQENGREVTRQLAELADEWNATHPDKRINRKLLVENPIAMVSKLITSRFKIALSITNGDETREKLSDRLKKAREAADKQRAKMDKQRKKAREAADKQRAKIEQKIAELEQRMAEAVDCIEIKPEQPVIDLLNMHAKRGSIGLAKFLEVVDAHNKAMEELQTEKDKTPTASKRDAVALLRDAWKQSGAPCSFSDVLAVFSGDLPDIESTSGYSVDALILGIKANFGMAA